MTGAARVRSSASATANYPAPTLTINRPSGTAAGDVLLATIGHQGDSLRTLNAPSGWTAVPNADASDGTNLRMRALYKVAAALEPASYTFTLTGGSGMALAGGMMSVTGADVTRPINVAATQAISRKTATIAAPPVTTTVARALLVYAGGVNIPLTFTPPPGASEQWDVTTAGSYNVATEAATAGFVGPGNTGPIAATATRPARGSALLIAIAPPAT